MLLRYALRHGRTLNPSLLHPHHHHRRHARCLFHKLSLSPEMQLALREANFHVPTEIQERAIPAILCKEPQSNVLLTAPTGTGKTLAYLVPLIEQVRRIEERHLQRPAALVVVPSRELATQVMNVIKILARHAKVSSCALTGELRQRKQREMLSAPIDIAVVTPGRAQMLLDKQLLYFSKLRHVVIDEADSMYGRTQGFAPALHTLMTPLTKRLRHEGQHIQFVLAAASLHGEELRRIQSDFPGIVHVRANDTHHTSPLVDEEFIRVTGDDNRLEMLLHVLTNNENDNDDDDDDDRLSVTPASAVTTTIRMPKTATTTTTTASAAPAAASSLPPLPTSRRSATMVFCNTVPSCRAVEHYLREHGVSSACFHSNMPSEVRRAEFLRFVTGEAECLVCTDIASRGLDTTFVTRVVNFDFPSNPAEYLHRVGRTGRAQTRGTVVSFVAAHDYLLAKTLEDAKLHHRPLDANLNFNAVRRNVSAEKRRAKAINVAKSAAAAAIIKARARGAVTAIRRRRASLSANSPPPSPSSSSKSAAKQRGRRRKS